MPAVKEGYLTPEEGVTPLTSKPVATKIDEVAAMYDKTDHEKLALELRGIAQAIINRARTGKIQLTSQYVPILLQLIGEEPVPNSQPFDVKRFYVKKERSYVEPPIVSVPHKETYFNPTVAKVVSNSAVGEKGKVAADRHNAEVERRRKQALAPRPDFAKFEKEPTKPKVDAKDQPKLAVDVVREPEGSPAVALIGMLTDKIEELSDSLKNVEENSQKLQAKLDNRLFSKVKRFFGF